MEKPITLILTAHVVRSMDFSVTFCDCEAETVAMSAECGNIGSGRELLTARDENGRTAIAAAAETAQVNGLGCSEVEGGRMGQRPVLWGFD